MSEIFYQFQKKDYQVLFIKIILNVRKIIKAHLAAVGYFLKNY